MRNDFRERLKRPHVAGHFPSLGSLDDIDPTTSMFIEDVHLPVMPISGRFRQTNDYSVKIVGNSEHEPRAIAILQSLTRGDVHSRPDLMDLLSDSVNEIARYLAWSGRAVYEIIRGEESNQAWRLYSFTDKRLFRTFRNYIQIIPKADQRLWGKTHVIIPEKDIWNIEIPKVLGGYRGYRKILKKLRKFPRLGPSFFTDEMDKEEWTTYFSNELYRREMELFVAKTTARLGWHMRNSGLRIWTEFYAMYRFVTLDWAKACMREHIINELNQLFCRLHIEAETVVEGLPTAQEILKIRQQCVKVIFHSKTLLILVQYDYEFYKSYGSDGLKNCLISCSYARDFYQRIY